MILRGDGDEDEEEEDREGERERGKIERERGRGGAWLEGGLVHDMPPHKLTPNVIWK